MLCLEDGARDISGSEWEISVDPGSRTTLLILVYRSRLLVQLSTIVQTVAWRPVRLIHQRSNSVSSMLCHKRTLLIAGRQRGLSMESVGTNMVWFGCL
jgi:hypothetical protein